MLFPEKKPGGSEGEEAADESMAVLVMGVGVVGSLSDGRGIFLERRVGCFQFGGQERMDKYK